MDVRGAGKQSLRNAGSSANSPDDDDDDGQRAYARLHCCSIALPARFPLAVPARPRRRPSNQLAATETTWRPPFFACAEA